jgi:cytochrome c oxidase subunit IV
MERDDLLVNDQYSIDAHHSEEDGKKIRKKIVFVTVLLSVITAVEVGLGIVVKQNSEYWGVVKMLFIILTLAKAAYIVMTFMHLGDERKNMRYLILFPYGLFALYLLFILIVEGGFSDYMSKLFP